MIEINQSKGIEISDGQNLNLSELKHPIEIKDGQNLEIKPIEQVIKIGAFSKVDLIKINNNIEINKCQENAAANVLFFDTKSQFPELGQINKIYVSKDNGIQWTWNTTHEKYLDPEGRTDLYKAFVTPSQVTVKPGVPPVLPTVNVLLNTLTSDWEWNINSFLNVVRFGSDDLTEFLDRHKISVKCSLDKTDFGVDAAYFVFYQYDEYGISFLVYKYNKELKTDYENLYVELEFYP